MATVKGSQRIATGWTTQTINGITVRKATLATAPRYAYLNGTELPEAQWPNEGSYAYNKSGTATSITSDVLSTAPSLVGARLHLLNTSFNWISRPVLTHNGNTITFPQYENSNSGVIPPGADAWGLYFTGKLAFLNNPGEWFYDPASKTIYVHSTEPQNIDWVTGANVRELGYRQNDVKMQDDEFLHGKERGVYINVGNNNSVTNCKIHKTFQGVVIAHNPPIQPTGNVVEKCEIFDCYDSAIVTMADNGKVTGNHIHHIALKPGMGRDNWGSIAVEQQAGQGNVFAYNKINDVGYIAIGARGNALVHNNVIRDWCLTLNDGGAIATEKSDGLTIRDNTLIVTKAGNFPACPGTFHGCGLRRKGIYKGMYSNKNLKVFDNVIVGCEGPGIFLDNDPGSDGDEIAFNVIVNCMEGISHSNWGPGTNSGRMKYLHNVHHNVVFCKDGDILSRHINAHVNDVDYGISDFNVFYTNNPKPFVRRNADGVPKSYSLKEWQDLTGREKNSVVKPYMNPEVITNDGMLPMTVELPSPMVNVKNGAVLQGSFLLPPMSSVVLRPAAVAPPPPPPPPPTSDYSTDQRKVGEITVAEMVKVIQFAKP